MIKSTILLTVLIVSIPAAAATGSVSHFKLDETSGSIAYDSARPRYVPDVVIIKYKKNAANKLAAGLSAKKKLKEMKVSKSLDKLNNKFKVKDIRPVFKNFKANRTKLEALKTKDENKLTKKEKHILKRQKRAPKNAKIPALDRIFKLTVEPEPGRSLLDIIAEYRKDADVEYAQLNYILKMFSPPNDEYYGEQWALNNTGQTGGTSDADIDAPEAWDLSGGTNNVVVAVIDTGVDYNHRDISSQMWTNSGEIADDNIDNDDNGYIDDIYGYDFYNVDSDPSDDDGHGTHCAGIIGAAANSDDIIGVCQNVEIMAIKFLGAGGSGTSSNAAQSILYAIENGAEVLSNSWGGGPGSEGVLKDAFATAHAEGLVIVAAAGNEYTTLQQYPAAWDNIISVAATDDNDDKGVFSTYGNWVDIAAPGVDILSLRASGTLGGVPLNDHTTYASGTSMACPYVAGASAYLLSYNPTLSNIAICDILKDNTDSLSDPNICQSGRLNLYSSLLDAHPSKGIVVLDDEVYPSPSVITIRLGDIDLASNVSQTVVVSTSSGDSETVTLTEAGTSTGIFFSTISTSTGSISTEDGALQVSHDDIVTVTYQDADDGTGSSATVTDTATVDIQGPVINNVQVYAPGSRVTVTFDTDELAVTNVFCGTSCGGPYIVDASGSDLSGSHSLSFNVSSQQTTYYFVMGAADEIGNVTNENNNGQCFSFTTSTAAGNIYVPSEYVTIQEGVDRAWDGDTVWIADGTYSGTGNYSIDLCGKSITVRSENGPDNCIIDCQMKGRGFILNGDQSGPAVLNGLTIINGYLYTNPNLIVTLDDYRGGGIFCKDSDLTISDCKIMYCETNFGEGGGVFCEDSNLSITDSVISHNKENNGGGICAYSGSLTVTRCRIESNRGSGIECRANLVMTDSIIKDNRGGSGIVLTGHFNFSISSSAIVGNEAGNGGGIYCRDFIEMTLENTLIYGNSASGNGGGVYNNSVGSEEKTYITNCVIAENTSNSNAGGLFCDSDIVLENSILWNNSCAYYGDNLFLYADATVDVSYCDVKGGQSTESIYVNDRAVLNWNSGNINSDPLFAFAEDFRLMSGSPCIDSGTNNPDGGLPATDADGSTRPVNGTADIGAYEFNGSVAGIAVSSEVVQFICVEGSNPAAEVFSIRNCGGGTLSWLISESCLWLSVDTATGTSTGEIDSVNLSVDSNGLTIGDYECELTVSDNGASNSPRIVIVKLHVGGEFEVPSQYPTIQSAINAAWDGDIVVVADGTYKGNGNRDIDFNGKAITLSSRNGPKNCVINCQGSAQEPHRAFICTMGEDTNTVIDGFTLTGGFGAYSSPAIPYYPYDGGAILCEGGYPAIKNCIITENTSSVGGGGISAWLTSENQNAILRIENCVISNNTAFYSGGGICTDLDDAIIKNCVISANTCYGYGGGVYFDFAGPEVINSTIAYNVASDHGGGIHVDGGWPDLELTLVNNILWGNSSPTGPQISEGNFYYHYYNDPDKYTKLNVSYCTVQDGQNGVWVDQEATLNWGDGILTSDPEFVAADSFYHLQPDSPCIDAGQRFPTGGLEGWDIEGHIRPIDGDFDGLSITDIGAYELLPDPIEFPIIAISAWEINYRAYQDGENPADQILSIHNSGAGTIDWTIDYDCDWLEVTPLSESSSGEINYVTLSVDTTGMVRGSYDCELTILDSSAINSPRTFQVNLQVLVEGDWYVPSDLETIQEAINESSDGDVIIVSPGVYQENINFYGKNITLSSINPDDPAVVVATIIDGDDKGTVVTFGGSETSGCELKGFTVQNGLSGYVGGGILGNGTEATVSQCIIRDNSAIADTGHSAGGGIHGVNGKIERCIIYDNTTNSDQSGYFGFGGGIAGSNALITNCLVYNNTAQKGGGLNNCDNQIINCTIADNTATVDGGGLSDIDGIIANCIIWGNVPNQFFISTAVPDYSCIKGGSDGIGNIDIDPDFIDSEGDDYHLQPGSFCIDAGTNIPALQFEATDLQGHLRQIDGDNDSVVIVDMGCYESLPSEEPVIDLSTWEVEFTIPDSEYGMFNIRNSGGETLNWLITYDCPWLGVNPMQGSSTGQNNQVVLTADPTGYTWGEYECILMISDDNAVNSPRALSVILHIFRESIYITSEIATIQNAIDSVLENGTVIVADGIYQGPGNCDIDFLGKSITVRSENGPDNCIIDSNGTMTEPHRGFYFHNGEGAESVLDGFTITSGYTGRDGGGIFCQGSKPTIKNCVFTANTADNGGGIYNLYSDPTLTNCVFTANTADNGGGIHNRFSNPVLHDCVFSANLAAREWWDMGGGGIYNYNSSPTVNNCNFTENLAAWDGGAISNITSSNPTITNCRFHGNSASGNDGGALFNSFESDPTVINCIFSENLAKSWGGAMRNNNSQPQITNCIFTGNFAGDNGGAIYNYNHSSSILSHCTFSLNSANGNDGDGMFNSLESYPIVANSIFWNNGSEIADDRSRTTVTFSNIKNGWVGEGNISIDPDFADADNGDFRLSPSSPCLDAGDNNSIPKDYTDLDNDGDTDEAVPFDIDGNCRIINGIVDMGAYEFDNVPPEFSVVMNPSELWPPDHQMVQVEPVFTVSDNCSDDITIELVDITSNEGDQDDYLIDDGVYLRAERSGEGDGRVYFLTYRAVDQAGNQSLARASVFVPHDQGQGYSGKPGDRNNDLFIDYRDLAALHIQAEATPLSESELLEALVLLAENWLK